MSEDNIPDWMKEKPNATIDTEGEQAGGGGLQLVGKGGGNPLMLNISPKFGNGWLVPYSRIDSVDISADSGDITLYGAGRVALIKGKETDRLIQAIQSAQAWSISEGQQTSNEVVIEKISITYGSDSDDDAIV